MRVAFLHVESTYQPEEIELQRALARRLIKSLKKNMDCHVVQLTDPITPNVGADEVSVKDPKGMYWMDYVLKRLIEQPRDTLYIDTDCVVQEDVSWIFKRRFDVCLTYKERGFPQYTDADEVTHHMPILGGVVFLREPGYWLDIKERMKSITDPVMRAWWGVQASMWPVYQTGKHNVLLLDWDRYNYTPNERDEDLSNKAIVHYKGNHRKTWNLDGVWVERPKEREVPLRAM